MTKSPESADEPFKTGWNPNSSCFFFDYRHNGRPHVFTLPADDDRDKISVCLCVPNDAGPLVVEHGTVRREDWQRLVDKAGFGSQLTKTADGSPFILADGPVDVLSFAAEVWELEIFEDVESFGFPRCWELLRFLLGAKLRQKVFEPAYNDLRADFLASRAARFQTKWPRRWITFCFAVRTFWLVVECAVVGWRGKAAALLIPWAAWNLFRKWWSGD